MEKQTVKRFYTFKTDGLTEKEINFLSNCEKLYFQQKQINLDFLKEAIKGIEKPFDFSSAWGYWKMLNSHSVFNRHTLIKPVSLQKYLIPTKKKGADIFECYGDIKGTFRLKHYDEFKDNILNDCHPYLEVSNGVLRLKYNSIIGGFKIAKVKF